MKTWIGGVTICADIEDLDVDTNSLVINPIVPIQPCGSVPRQ
jgi:hypothetical protein